MASSPEPTDRQRLLQELAAESIKPKSFDPAQMERDVEHYAWGIEPLEEEDPDA